MWREGRPVRYTSGRPMDRAHVELDATGQIVVDSSRLFMWDRAKGGRDQFNDPGAYIPL